MARSSRPHPRPRLLDVARLQPAVGQRALQRPSRLVRRRVPGPEEHADASALLAVLDELPLAEIA